MLTSLGWSKKQDCRHCANAKTAKPKKLLLHLLGQIISFVFSCKHFYVQILNPSHLWTFIISPSNDSAGIFVYGNSLSMCLPFRVVSAPGAFLIFIDMSRLFAHLPSSACVIAVVKFRCTAKAINPFHNKSRVSRTQLGHPILNKIVNEPLLCRRPKHKEQ